MNDARDILLAWCRRVGSNGMVVVDKGSASWHLWRTWRKRHHLGTAFMESQERWSVPSDTPPDDDDQFSAMATAGRKYER